MTKRVITSSDIQVEYEQLYQFLMDYLWEFKVVQALANLEIAIFRRFPDKDEMLRRVRELRLEVSHTFNDLAEDDEPDFKEAFEDLEEVIENYENSGCELYAVQEVIDDPEDVAAAEEIDYADTGSQKRAFRVGNISKRTAEERRLQEEASNTLSNPFEVGEE